MNSKTYISGSLAVLLILILNFCILVRPLHAVEIHPNAGTTSASFLKLGLGSRAIGMGGAFAALADDASALYWNPAGLAQLKFKELNVTHNESFESIKHDFVGYAHPLFNGVLAGALYGLYTPNDIERRAGLNEEDPYEPLTPVEGYFQAYDIAAHLSYGRWIKDNLAGGASIKFIQQNIDDHSASGAAVDIGILYFLRNIPLSLGFSAQNMGTPIKFLEKGYPLPFNLRLGSAYRINERFIAALDLNKAIDNFLFVSAGTEYSPIELLSLRLGYKYRLTGLELGELSGIAAGVGFNFKVNNLIFKFDYAMVPFGVLGDSHRFSLNLLFCEPAMAERVSHKTKTALPNIPVEPAAVVTLSDQPAAAETIISDTSDYVFYTIKTSTKLKMATGRISIFSVTGTSEESSIITFEGIIRNFNPKEMVLEVGEKSGMGDVYKSFIFKNNIKTGIHRVKCLIHLPKEINKFTIKTNDGTIINTLKVLDDEEYSYYQFSLDKLQSFNIQKLETQ